MSTAILYSACTDRLSRVDRNDMLDVTLSSAKYKSLLKYYLFGLTTMSVTCRLSTPKGYPTHIKLYRWIDSNIRAQTR